MRKPLTLYDAFVESLHEKVVTATSAMRIIVWRRKRLIYSTQDNAHYDYTIAHKMLSGGDFVERDVAFMSLETTLQSLNVAGSFEIWTPLEWEHATS